MALALSLKTQSNNLIDEQKIVTTVARLTVLQ